MKPFRHDRRRSAWTVVGALGCLGVAALAAPSTAQTPTTGIALVDMQRLLDEAPQMAEARARLTREFSDRNAELERQRSQLEQMQSRLRDQGSGMPRQEGERLALEIDVLRRALQRAEERLREQLSTRNREERDRVWLQLNDAVAHYARESGNDLVLATPVLYGSARIDITDRILDRLRRQAREAQP